VAITAPSPAAVIRPKINIAREIVNRSVIAVSPGAENSTRRNSSDLA
jgi:hypothetical protein